MGKKRIDNIGNEEICARADVANISETIREHRQIWLGHVERKTEEDVMRIRHDKERSASMQTQVR